MSKEVATQGLNRAKPYQLVLFPFNNGATNVYYILTATYIAYYGNGVLRTRADVRDDDGDGHAAF